MARPAPTERHESNPAMMLDCPKKRIIVCCDGTWQDSDSFATPPSNVTRISRAIPPVGVDYTSGRAKPIQQVVFYQNGIGTGSGGWYQKYIGSQLSGATGEGLIFNIRVAYAFICHNYHHGDEIILIGFSRGAFTARTISSLIKQLGLLTPMGLSYLVEIIDDWEYQLNTTRKTPYPHDPWANRPPFTDKIYLDTLVDRKLTRPNIPVRCVAVWDTVGALGVPSTALATAVQRWFRKVAPRSMLRLFKPSPREFAFVDTAVLDNIEYAFHSLGLDEKRESFTPTMWYKKEGQVLPKVLKQTWFPGVHSDVGGSYDNCDNANITLAWMIGQLETYKIITFNRDYVIRLIHQTIQDHERAEQALKTATKADDAEAKLFGPLRDWGLGEIHDSYTLFFRLGGASTRTPKEYKETTRDEGTTDRLLVNTNEAMHASVRVRMARGGLGMNDEGTYKSSALKDWSYAWKEESNPDTPHQQSQPGEVGRLKGVYWEKLGSQDGKTVKVAQMLEDDLTEFERIVLRHWTAAEDGWEATADRREDIVDSARSKDRESPMSERRYWTHDRESLPSIVEDQEHGGDVDPRHLHIMTDVQRAPVGHTPREQVTFTPE